MIIVTDGGDGCDDDSDRCGCCGDDSDRWWCL